MSWYENAASDPTIGPVVPQGKTVAKARGYSLLELKRAGLTTADAERLGIPVEADRNSLIGTNVMQLMLRVRG